MALTKVKVTALTSFFNLTLVLTQYGKPAMGELQNVGVMLVISSVFVLSYCSSVENDIECEVTPFDPEAINKKD